jgi:hypothetical protein
VPVKTPPTPPLGPLDTALRDAWRFRWSAAKTGSTFIKYSSCWKKIKKKRRRRHRREMGRELK